MPATDPPCGEFLWGSGAHEENSKTKLLEFLVKVNKRVPSVFSSPNEEDLHGEKERARARAAAGAGTLPQPL